MRPHTLLYFLILLLAGISAHAQHPSQPHKKQFLGFHALSDTVDTEKKGAFILPLLYYTPDTRWAVGGAGVYYFKLGAKTETEHETRMSNVQFLSDYTQNKQLDVWGQWNVFTHNENYLFKGELRYRNFPDRFYGIGNRSLKSAEEKYEYSLFSFKTLALKKVYPALFLGMDYHFEKEYGFSYAPLGILQSKTITGYNGGIQSAIGLVGIYDSRDNVINTYKGCILELSSYFYAKELGSTFGFTYLNGIYQKFWQVKRRHIIAIQARARYGFGQVPFLDMSNVGNDDMLRGYPKNRFRDVNFLGAQVEYRFPLFWRLGMVTFAGAGDVFNSHYDLGMNELKYSIGAGLRFVVNPAERLNIRIDYGYGREGGYFYFVVAEAF